MLSHCRLHSLLSHRGSYYTHTRMNPNYIARYPGMQIFGRSYQVVLHGLLVINHSCYCLFVATHHPTSRTNICVHVQGMCFAPKVVPLCSGNGKVLLPYGTAAYVGLGAIVFGVLVVIELFGCASMAPSAPSGCYLPRGFSTRCLRPSLKVTLIITAHIHKEACKSVYPYLCSASSRRRSADVGMSKCTGVEMKA